MYYIICASHDESTLRATDWRDSLPPKRGELPGVQYGSGFVGNLVSGLKRIALPVLKAVGKAALPMAKEALMTGLAAKGSVRDRLKAGGQTALTKRNLVGLTKAGRKAVMAHPF